MTDAEPGPNILALNSGSSSLKFGLYLVGSSRTEMLLSGEAESIGDEKGKFHAQISRENAVLSETVSILSQRDAIIRIGRLLADSKLPTPAPSGIESCMADRSSGGIASLMIRSYVNLKLLPPSRRCIFHRLYRSSASRKSIFLGVRRWRVSTPPFTPN